MKKKSSITLIVIIAIVAFAVAAFMIFCPCSKDKEPGRAEINEPYFGYINLEQLATKGAFDRYFDANNRKMLASMASANIEDKAMADHATAIITDFSASGLNIKQPAYGYVDAKDNGVVIIEVADIEKVDKSIELLSYLGTKNNSLPINIQRNGDDRIVELDGFMLGYNTSRLAVVFNEYGEALNDVLIDALQRPLTDLSLFGDADIATYVHFGKILENTRGKLEEQKAESLKLIETDPDGAYYYTRKIEEIDAVLTQFDDFAQYTNENSYGIVALTFDAGRATIDTYSPETDSLPTKDITKLVNNKHLSYIDATAPIVANLGLNGEKFVEFADLFLQSSYFLESEYNTNEINMVIAVARDVFKSIDGDLTIAVENLEGSYKSYYGRAGLKNAAATIMVDVKDEYIISNLSQFAGSFLRRQDSTHYSGGFGGFNITLGQDDNVFHAGINSPYVVRTESADTAEWFNDVEESYGYLVVDVENLMNCSYIAAANQALISDMNSESADVYNKFVDICDYVYMSQSAPTTGELVIVLDDKQTNALQQIADIVMPIIMRELFANM